MQHHLPTSPRVWGWFLLLVWTIHASAFGQIDLNQDFGLGGNDFVDVSPVQWGAEYTLNDDGTGVVQVSAEIAADWVVYAMTLEKGAGPIKLDISLSPQSKGFSLGKVFAVTPPHVIAGTDPSWPGKRIEKHEGGRAIWQAPLSWESGAPPTELNLVLQVRGQTCKVDAGSGMTSTCLPINDKLNAKKSLQPIVLAQSAQVESNSADAGMSLPKDAGSWKNYPLTLVLCLAFLAGLILNVMPCVLPVIGLKIMSFVNQAGANPRRIVILNVVFSVGIISVFMILATLAAFFQLGWGGLYQQMGFTVLMISVIFVFGLSFLGVWEIPIPGFSAVTTGGSEAQEGLMAAFLKGVLTTFLATPCSGPMLVPAVVWAIAQPTWVTYLVFFSMGLGMAAPYLVLGIFPKMMRLLPRPGNWMVTFKQLMGFALMAAVVFFVSAIPEKYETSVLSLLVFLGVACWVLGSTSAHAELMQKLRSWAAALAVALIGIAFSFFWLVSSHELDWQPYSKATLNKLLDEGATVLVDFTAEWCGTCKANERLALNTKIMKSYVADNGIITLKADFTERSTEISEILKQLGNETTAIPYYAYFQKGERKPIHFDGLYLTPKSFLRKLESEAMRRKEVANRQVSTESAIEFERRSR